MKKITLALSIMLCGLVAFAQPPTFPSERKKMVVLTSTQQDTIKMAYDLVSLPKPHFFKNGETEILSCAMRLLDEAGPQVMDDGNVFGQFGYGIISFCLCSCISEGFTIGDRAYRILYSGEILDKAIMETVKKLNLPGKLKNNGCTEYEMPVNFYSTILP